MHDVGDDTMLESMVADWRGGAPIAWPNRDERVQPR